VEGHSSRSTSRVHSIKSIKRMFELGAVSISAPLTRSPSRTVIRDPVYRIDLDRQAWEPRWQQM
jgi:hypothetical protein